MGDLREAITLLEQRGELERVRDPVDPRFLAPLFHKSDRAVLVERPVGYEIAAIGNIFNARRIAALLGVSEDGLAQVMGSTRQKQIPPRIVDDGPVRANVITSPDDVDLTRLPVPLLYAEDGAPYLSASVLVTEERGKSRNAGVYRLMLRTRRETGIDLVPSIVVWENDRPFTAKVGFDAAISTESPRSRYQRIVYPYAGDAVVQRILAGQAAAMPQDDDTDAALAKLRKRLRRGPAYFRDLLDGLPRFTYRAVVEALGRANEAGALGQDGEGQYYLREADPP
jgi:hypothetical protein